jgi:hypothetical protein
MSNDSRSIKEAAAAPGWSEPSSVNRNCPLPPLEYNVNYTYGECCKEAVSESPVNVSFAFCAPTIPEGPVPFPDDPGATCAAWGHVCLPHMGQSDDARVTILHGSKGDTTSAYAENSATALLDPLVPFDLILLDYSTNDNMYDVPADWTGIYDSLRHQWPSLVAFGILSWFSPDMVKNFDNMEKTFG